MATFVKAEVNGQQLVFDFESITAREYKVIKRHTGLKMGEFERAFQGLAEDGGIDIELVDCLRWLFLKRAGHNVDPATLDDYLPAEFMHTFDVVPEVKPAGAEAAPLAPSTDEQPST